MSCASFWWFSAGNASVWWSVLSIAGCCGEVWSSRVAVQVVGAVVMAVLMAVVMAVVVVVAVTAEVD